MIKVAIKSIRILSLTDDKKIRAMGKVSAGIDIQFHSLIHSLPREFAARPMSG
jgi:hypothetical protein